MIKKNTNNDKFVLNSLKRPPREIKPLLKDERKLEKNKK